MKKIEAIIRPEKLELLKEVISSRDIGGMTIREVFGYGKQKGHSEIIRAQEVVPTVVLKAEVVFIVPDEKVEEMVQLIIEITRTGEVGDGKIFISNVEEAIRIRTGERGIDSL